MSRGIGRFIAGFALGALVLALVGIGGLVWIGHALRVEDPLERVDAIIAISGDTGPRVHAAVALWSEGYAQTLIFSGGARDPASPSSGEIMKRQAVSLGVPPEVILVEPEAETTDQNAERVALLMKEAGLKSAILVTSAFHQRRASLHFTREFERHGLTFRNRPADDPNWDPTLWWTERASRTVTLVELAKIAVEALDGRFDKPQQGLADR